MENLWPPQVDSQFIALVKRAAPDLIVGLMGVPVALAFQQVSSKIMQMEKGHCLFLPFLVAFLYLAGMYLFLSLVLLDILHCPWNWGNRREKWLRFLSVSVAITFLALLAVYGQDFVKTTKFVLAALLFVSMALLPDIWRGRRWYEERKSVFIGLAVIVFLSFTWWAIFFH